MTGPVRMVLRLGQVDFPRATRLARAADDALFDAVLLDNPLGLVPGGRGTLEPTALAAALAVVTRHVGLVVTASTSHYEPYHLARILATLDFVSDGRAGWYVVTGAHGGETANFGGVRAPADLSEQARRARAEEFFDVVTGLWDSFDDDAFPYDRETGVYLDLAKLHRLDHVGTHFRVAGPRNIARPPQGRPVVFAPAAGPVADRADVLVAGDLEPAGPPGGGPVLAEMSTVDCLDRIAGGVAADGFVLTLPDLPGAVEDFVERVVPALRELGLCRQRPAGATLRDHFGIERPASRYVTTTARRP